MIIIITREVCKLNNAALLLQTAATFLIFRLRVNRTQLLLSFAYIALPGFVSVFSQLVLRMK